MSYHSTVDTIAARLHREGWNVGDIAVKAMGLVEVGIGEIV
jgi:hypothetical protein